MISIQSRVRVPGISGSQLVDFMLHCTDAQYQAWWPGVHLAFHTTRFCPGDVGNIVEFDELVGKRRLKMKGVVAEVLPGKKIVWQFVMGFRLPAWLILETVDDDPGVALTHTIQAGFNGIGRALDPLLRLYFSAGFARDLDEHAHAEFPMLAAMLSGAAQGRA